MNKCNECHWHSGRFGNNHECLSCKHYEIFKDNFKPKEPEFKLSSILYADCPVMMVIDERYKQFGLFKELNNDRWTIRLPTPAEVPVGIRVPYNSNLPVPENFRDYKMTIWTDDGNVYNNASWQSNVIFWMREE